MMHKFDKFIVDPTVIDHDNMIEINKKYWNQQCLFYYLQFTDIFDSLFYFEIQQVFKIEEF